MWPTMASSLPCRLVDRRSAFHVGRYYVSALTLERAGFSRHMRVLQSVRRSKSLQRHLWNNPGVITNVDDRLHRFSIPSRPHSTAPAARESSDIDNGGGGGGPVGDLFGSPVGPGLVGRSSSIRRSFGPRSNAQAMLTCGGPGLARHASFDPEYGRAREWIRSHAVGPAVLSPVLIQGLVGALVEASVPQSVPVGSTMRQIRPIIVGVEMEAKITAVSVSDGSDTAEKSEAMCMDSGPNDRFKKGKGYEVILKTECTRVRDGAVIAEGCHTIWIPDYMHM